MPEKDATWLPRRRKKSGKMLPGPSYAVPLVGGVVQMVMDPFKFWEDQRLASFPGVHFWPLKCASQQLAPPRCICTICYSTQGFPLTCQNALHALIVHSHGPLLMIACISIRCVSVGSVLSVQLYVVHHQMCLSVQGCRITPSWASSWCSARMWRCLAKCCQ